MRRRCILAFAAIAALAWFSSPSQNAFAVVSVGAGGQGVTVGNSSLIGTLDYSDTFTQTANGGAPGRPSTAAIQPPPAYNVENSYGNPPRVFSIGAGFSFASDTAGLVNGVPSYPGTSGAGSATGFTQTGFGANGGGLDYGFAYGLRDQYVVQVDAIQQGDRIDVTSGPTPATIFAANSLSVFFRGDGSGNASLYNGASDTPIRNFIPSFDTGLTLADKGKWHNYAVRYDRTGKKIEIYVDEASKGIIDLTTFANGLYQNFSNGAVGAGAGVPAGENRTWTDNFQVGGIGAPPPPPGVHPNPGTIPGLPAGLVSFWDFDEASGPEPGLTLDYAWDRRDGNHGSFLGTTARTTGIVGRGAAEFHNAVGEGVNVGAGVVNNFFTPNGITVEALFTTTWDGVSDQSEFFRKEDGNNRILLSFQTDANTNNAFGQLIGSDTAPGISLGLNTGVAGYTEMDVALDGQNGRPTLAELANGDPHHIVATYDAATGMKAIYIDGNLIGAFDGPDNAPIIDGGAADAYIGSDRGIEPFNGVLDEVAVWNRALPPAEIAAHLQNFAQGQNYFVPEPGTWSLAAIGMAVMAAVGAVRRRNG